MSHFCAIGDTISCDAPFLVAQCSATPATVAQRTPWGGGKKRGVENLTNDTPPKKGFWTPLVRYVFHPPQVSVLCFSCTKFHDRADQKLFWRGPKIFGRARSLVRFPPPIRFAPLHITAQVAATPPCSATPFQTTKFRCDTSREWGGARCDTKIFRGCGATPLLHLQNAI